MRKEGKPVTRRNIQRALGNGVKVRECGEVIDTLEMSGRIVPMAPKKTADPKKGRPAATHYRLA